MDRTIREEMQRECAHERFNEQTYRLESNFDRTRRFHKAMDLTVRDTPETPSVSERILRAKLLLEETLETITKGLGLRIGIAGDDVFDYSDVGALLEVNHFEGDFYDPIETLDGLADVKVIANGTAVAFGLPMDQADYEVFCSNMTKLDADGKPVVNRCLACHPKEREIARENLLCIDEAHQIHAWIDSSKPIGKLLKSEQYVEANIARIIVESEPEQELEESVLSWLLHNERKS